MDVGQGSELPHFLSIQLTRGGHEMEAPNDLPGLLYGLALHNGGHDGSRRLGNGATRSFEFNGLDSVTAQ